MPGITSALILFENFKREAYNGFNTNGKEEKFSGKDRAMNIEEVAKKCNGNCGTGNEVQDNNVVIKYLSDCGDDIVKHGSKYKANCVKCNPCGVYEDAYWHDDRAKSVGFADCGVYSASCGGCGGGCSSCGGGGCQGGGCSGSCGGGGGCSS